MNEEMKTPYSEITEAIDAVVDSEPPEKSPPSQANIWYTITIAKLYEARESLLRAQLEVRKEAGIE